MSTSPILSLPEWAPTSLQPLLHPFLIIIFSEIGDKTFLIAAILSMRHPRIQVFSGAILSLIVMSILSASLGHVLPALLPKRWTQCAAGVLFLVFGIKMWFEARAMKGGNEEIQEEMKEAEEEIEGDDGREDSEGIPLEAMEAGTADQDMVRTSIKKKKAEGIMDGARNCFSFLFGPVLVQAFVLTFLGEWGDRSQIATMALGAAHNVYLVSLGTILGHTCCTALAVIGGRYISTKISIKHVTLGGSVLFFIFGLIYLYESFTDIDMDASFDLDHSLPISPGSVVY
jgi:putative Ca2+/H+ antiporter (TMEM165/GDT1 family)